MNDFLERQTILDLQHAWETRRRIIILLTVLVTKHEERYDRTRDGLFDLLAEILHSLLIANGSRSTSLWVLKPTYRVHLENTLRIERLKTFL